MTIRLHTFFKVIVLATVVCSVNVDFVEAQYDQLTDYQLNNQQALTKLTKIDAVNKVRKVSGEVHPEKAEEKAYNAIAKTEIMLPSVPSAAPTEASKSQGRNAVETLPSSSTRDPNSNALDKESVNTSQSGNKIEAMSPNEGYQMATAPKAVTVDASLFISSMQSNNVDSLSPAEIFNAQATPVSPINSNSSAKAREQPVSSISVSNSSLESLPATPGEDKKTYFAAISSKRLPGKEEQTGEKHSVVSLNKIETYGTLPPSSQPFSPAFSELPRTSTASATNPAATATMFSVTPESVPQISAEKNGTQIKPIGSFSKVSSKLTLVSSVGQKLVIAPSPESFAKAILGIKQAVTGNTSASLQDVENTQTVQETPVDTAATTNSSQPSVVQMPSLIASLSVSTYANDSSVQSSLRQGNVTETRTLPNASNLVTLPVVETTRPTALVKVVLAEEKSNYFRAASSDSEKSKEALVNVLGATERAPVAEAYAKLDPAPTASSTLSNVVPEVAETSEQPAPFSKKLETVVQPENSMEQSSITTNAVAQANYSEAANVSSIITSGIMDNTNKYNSGDGRQQLKSTQAPVLVARGSGLEAASEAVSASQSTTTGKSLEQMVEASKKKFQAMQVEQPTAPEQSASAQSTASARPAQPNTPQKPVQAALEAKKYKPAESKEYASYAVSNNNSSTTPTISQQPSGSESQIELQTTSNNESITQPFLTTPSAAATTAAEATQGDAVAHEEKILSSSSTALPSPGVTSAGEPLNEANNLKAKSTKVSEKAKLQEDTSLALSTSQEAPSANTYELKGKLISLNQSKFLETRNRSEDAISQTGKGVQSQQNDIKELIAAVSLEQLSPSTPSVAFQAAQGPEYEGVTYEKPLEDNSETPTKPELSKPSSSLTFVEPIKPEDAVGYGGLAPPNNETHKASGQETGMVISPKNKNDLLLYTLPIRQVDASTKKKWKPFEMNCSVETDERGSELCSEWASSGLCDSHRATMFLFCRKTCLCIGPPQPDPASTEELSAPSTSSVAYTTESEDSQKFASFKRRRHSKNRFEKLRRVRL